MQPASDAPDRLRELARRLRRDGDPYRADPERQLAARQEVAADLRALADAIEGRR